MSVDATASHFPSMPGPADNVLQPGTVVPMVVVAQPSPAAITIVPDDGSAELKIPASAYSLQGFRDWAVSDDFPIQGKITFAGGELIVDMSPESFEEQGAVKAEICRVLLQLVRERKLGYFRIDRTLISNKEAELSNEPDAVFVANEAIQSGRVTFVPEVGRPQSSKELLGTVDWVLEIVSPSSRRKDAHVLRQTYYLAGIPEYWLIDVLGDEIDFQMLVPGESGYRAVAPVDGMLQSPAFGARFRLTRERDKLGYWNYTLEMKEQSSA